MRTFSIMCEFCGNSVDLKKIEGSGWQSVSPAVNDQFMEPKEDMCPQCYKSLQESAPKWANNRRGGRIDED